MNKDIVMRRYHEEVQTGTEVELKTLPEDMKPDEEFVTTRDLKTPIRNRKRVRYRGIG